MDFPAQYKIFGPKPLTQDRYSISSIQLEDAEEIRCWRNEQMSALRQSMVLSEEEQLAYFENVLKPEFNQTHPKQVLVRFCLSGKLIGYGGIVHLDWENLRGEVSFLLATERTSDSKSYCEELNLFFALIKRLGFCVLGLNKLTTEAYAHRAFHVQAIEDAGFSREGVLRQHVKIEGQWVDAVVASYLKTEYLK
jgi:RimJ/RimL family protein N-acetyltransferase